MELDYKKEYRDYHGKPEHIKERTERNKARREMKLKKGDPREVDHISPSIGTENQRTDLQCRAKAELLRTSYAEI